MNEETLAGVDSDLDNVRDDIQRWISYESAGNDDLKVLLKKIAAIYQYQILNHESLLEIRNKEIQKNDVIACLMGKVNNDNTSLYYITMLEHFFQSTRNRSANFAKVKDGAWQVGAEAIPDEASMRLAKCAQL